MSGDTPLHLLSVWNPSYADDAMDQHLEVLLGWAERRDRGEAEEEDVYVWWGKLRSPRLEEALSGEPEPDRLTRLRDGPHDVRSPVPHQSLGSLNSLLKHDGTA